MPKMKTKKSAAKRFRVRPGGTVKRGYAFKSHILTKKTTKNKRQLRGTENVSKADVPAVKTMMPYA
ncbi:Ribosomal protein A [Oligella ureolytica]|uniref:Large ribosomal subunit protein bL35 n=1 Tax=Oligella ureolytica TaxID=90244 RepID=A0A378XA09_9BURK|nr:50S ribosomal protein L35 [Oligella ureolytica]NLP32663.1 50S ribosomal protein L35 [Oligella ureolytica]QPT40245.1 50S ribosomal protein L35 [Oligella ureolytica]SUA50508.1 Ribosomal protein A [Oligella ureolytica]SUA51179.1 Ribosomal protein A [Oligella ureolytica]